MTDAVRRKISEAQKARWASGVYSASYRQKQRQIARERGFGKWMRGKRHRPETIEKLRTATWAGRRIRSGYKQSAEFSRKLSLARRGANSSFWRGGRTAEHVLIRSSYRYDEWRRQVFERDGYRCLDCGEKGGRLNAHHLFPFSQFTRLRFDLNNGVTLCEACHRKTPTFGARIHKH